ncbi:unknown [Prevotella sp. CAG:873]|nr:unknown [Prevotella sp. CAG:873]
MVEAAYYQGVAIALTTDGDGHEPLAGVYPCFVEVQRGVRLAEYLSVLALGSAYCMVVHVVPVVGIAICFALFGRRVCAVIEAVAVPCGAGEFGPNDMVFQELLRGGVHDEYFGPVTAAAAYGVGGVLAVGAYEYAGEGDCTIIAECVGVDEHLAVDGSGGIIGTIENALVAQPVVFVEIVSSVGFARGQSVLGVVVEALQTPVYCVAPGYGIEIFASDGVLGLDPCRDGCGRVVFQRSVRVGDLYVEVCVRGVIVWRHGISLGRVLCKSH